MAIDVENMSKAGTDQEEPATSAPGPVEPGPAPDEAPHPAHDAVRLSLPTEQDRLSRLGDSLASPLYRRRRQTVVLLSLVVLAILIYVAVGEINLDPSGAGPTTG